MEEEFKSEYIVLVKCNDLVDYISWVVKGIELM